MPNNNATKFGLLLVATVSIYAFLLPSFRQGMFLDGQQYAVVAMHYAEGKGTFWHPHLSNSWGYYNEPAFLEHPPLGYALQSVAFRIFGNSYVAERFYNVFIFLISLGLLAYLWQFLAKQKLVQASHTAWLPLLLFGLIETAMWAFRNNVLETQMAIFDLLAIIAILKSYYSTSKTQIIAFAIAAGIFTTCAVFTKGVPGLFPLVAPIGLYILGAKSRNLTILILAGLTFLGLSFLIYISSAEATQALDYYINKRLLNRIESAPTVSTRFSILFDLFSHLIPVLLTLVPVWLMRKKIALTSDRKKTMLFFLFIGISASLPLMLTLVQRGFYLYPSYFYFVLAAALLSEIYWAQLLAKGSKKLFNMTNSVLLFACGVGLVATYILAGTPGRDKAILADVETLKTHLPPNTQIFYNVNGISEDYSWPLYMYVLRFTNLSPSTKEIHSQSEFCIQNKGEKPRPGYAPVDFELNKFDLYKKQPLLETDHDKR